LAWLILHQVSLTHEFRVSIPGLHAAKQNVVKRPQENQEFRASVQLGRNTAQNNSPRSKNLRPDAESYSPLIAENNWGSAQEIHDFIHEPDTKSHVCYSLTSSYWLGI
jgi:hypothetical protein